MGLKFLNKKGWHTGSLRNIENVWKAEQKHHAEQRKLDELRKQIHEERERDEFRALQIEAGLTPRQERLEFLYDSGLAVGKSSSEGFKELDAFPRAGASAPAPSPAPASASESTPDLSKSSAPGALFEEKPQSANDAWRKLHSDPLLMIRQREQEALTKIKNNPVKMAIIRKSVEAKNRNDDSFEGEHQKVKSKRRKHSSSKYHSVSDDDRHDKKERRRREKKKHKDHLDSDEDSREEEERRKTDKKKNDDHLESDKDSRDRERHHMHSYRVCEGENQWHGSPSKHKSGRSQENTGGGARHINRHSRRDYEGEDGERSKRSYEKARHEDNPWDNKYEDRERNSHRDYEGEDVERSKRSYEKKAKREDNLRDHQNDKDEYKAKKDASSHQVSDSNHCGLPPKPDLYKRRGKAPQLSEEERAARLREMQMDAEVHEEQRWKRLKKAEEDDVREASQAHNTNRGSSFLDAVQKSVYGAEKGGSSSIEESVRRRTYFLQGSRDASERIAFRR